MASDYSEKQSSVRWRILALLAGFSLVSYVLRTNISITAKFMMPELGLNEIRMGQVFSSFMLGYAIFQIPAGLLGDRLGPRVVLTVTALLCGAATVLTGLVPGVIIGSAAGVFGSLLIIRFMLGAAEAATYPVAARAVATWMPVSERTFANAVVIAGSTIGMVFTPPLISWLMVAIGWRKVFLVTSGLGFLIAIIWHRYATDHPPAHRRINDAELIAIYAGRPEPTGARKASWQMILRNRNLQLICLSYFLDSFVLFIFVFWFYLYLVEERGFSVLKGGFFNSLPYVFAAVMIPACGRLCDLISSRRGSSMGRRIMAISCLVLSAVFLFAGARMAEPVTAIICLSFGVGCLMSTEGPFWASSIDVVWPHAGTAGGIMNTAGNLGGVVSTALAPVLVKSFGWGPAFAACSGLAIIAAVIWLFIDQDQTHFETERSS